jgi:hypothetical protein
VTPWADGAPPAVVGPAGQLFRGYPSDAYFWDTVSYIGLLPLMAAAWLLARACLRRTRPPAPGLFLGTVALLALLTALPVMQDVISRLPGTLLRSPARQLYLVTFALAVALGAAVHLLTRARGRWPVVVVAMVLSPHVLDLGLHDRNFVWMTAMATPSPAAPAPGVEAAVGAGARVAVDRSLPAAYADGADDVGFFDSVILARPYAALLRLAGLPPTRNVQAFDASGLNVDALRATGVAVVVTRRERPDLTPLDDGPLVHTYAVPDPLPRVAFGPGTATTPTIGAAVAYQRPSADEIRIDLTAPTDGRVRVLESWDPGWHATVNGTAAETVPMDDVYLGVPVRAGANSVRLTFATPGRVTGAALSLAAAGVLAAVVLPRTDQKRSRSAARAA